VTGILVSIAGLTDRGPARSYNEDTFLVSDLGREITWGPDEIHERFALGRGLVIGVYDGVGGAASGDLASRDAAVSVAMSMREEPLPATEDQVRDRLVRAVAVANRHVFDASSSDTARRGSGTTATVAAIVGTSLLVAQAGDTRAYLLRTDGLMAITRDDRLDAETVRAAGHPITDEEAKALPRGVVLKALGMKDEIEPAITDVTLRRGDVVLLSSDGLTDVVPESEIRKTLLRQQNPGVACRVLRDQAIRAGGTDNITVVVARLDGEGLRSPIEPETLRI
jgi:PPM family protein phosphatase